MYYSVNKMKFPFQIMITDLNTENCEELFTAYAMNKTRHRTKNKKEKEKRKY